MKKILFSFILFSFLALGAQAQHAGCCKPGSKSAACMMQAPSTASTSSIESSAAAEKVAAMDETIEMRSDPLTGTKTYVRKETSAKDGSVSFVSVSFDPESNSFVNVSSMETGEGHNMEESSSTPMAPKACCAKGMSSGKSCCAGKAVSAKPGEKTKS